MNGNMFKKEHIPYESLVILVEWTLRCPGINAAVGKFIWGSIVLPVWLGSTRTQPPSLCLSPLLDSILPKQILTSSFDPFTETVQATRGLLATDHVILNHGQVTWTTPELAPPLLTTTPHQREDVSALDRFNVHRCPTRRVFSGTGLEPVTKQATVRYLYHSATAATRPPCVLGGIEPRPSCLESDAVTTRLPTAPIVKDQGSTHLGPPIRKREGGGWTAADVLKGLENERKSSKKRRAGRFGKRIKEDPGVLDHDATILDLAVTSIPGQHHGPKLWDPLSSAFQNDQPSSFPSSFFRSSLSVLPDLLKHQG
ncbi:uncharacterized protein TNCV_2034161 [Trichonephila clavipes]|nr:uncharacterized protein TNCV_2034161 [Trichonephila clavipes]